MNKQNNPDMVICPACVHEFPGIPENVQAELIGLRAALAAKDAEIERLRAEVETQAWNLGGISTLACSRKLVEFDSSMARPALHDVAALVKDYSALASAVPEQKPEICPWCGKRVEVRG